MVLLADAVVVRVASLSSFARRSRSRNVISDMTSELTEPGITGMPARPSVPQLGVPLETLVSS